MTDNYCVNCRYCRKIRALFFFGPVLDRECWHNNNSRMDGVSGKRIVLFKIDYVKDNHCEGKWFEVKK